MAEMEFNYEKLAEAIAKATAAASKPGGTRPDLSGKSTAELVKEINGMMKAFQDGRSKVTKFNDLLKGSQAAVLTIEEFGKELEELDKAIAKAATTEEANLLIQKRAEAEKAILHRNNIAIMQNFGQEMRKVAGTGLQGAGNFVKGLQGGGSGMEIATGMMTTAADMAGQTTKAFGDAAGAAGQTMMASTNPKLKALGAIASVAGPLIGTLGEKASQLAKFGIEVLSKEVEKTVKAFHDATSSGAMFADGMTGLRSAANSAGLTVDQFAGVLKEKSETIAAAGMGVTEGAKRIGAALNAGGPEMKKQLQKLGFGFEEQAGLVADTMAIMRQSGKAALQPAAVAEQTQKYADNLRTIAAITGEDAKKKMAQVKEQANQLAFQQKLAKMEPEQRAAAIRAMANMSEIERKNFMDMVNFGTVVNKEGAAAQAMSQGLTDSVSESYAAFKAGQLDDTKQREISAKHGEAIKNELLGNEALAQAGAAGVGGLVQSLSESLGKELQYRNIVNEDSIKAAQDAVQKQKETNDKLTESVMGAERAAQDLKIALEKELTPAIAKFAEVSKEMLGSVQETLRKLGLGSGGGKEEGPSFWDKLKSAGSKAVDYGVTGATVGGITGTVVPGVGNVVGTAVGGVTGLVAGAIKGWFDAKEGKNVGGIAEGSPTGFLEKLHGKELIVPLTESGGLKSNTVGYEELMQRIGTIKSAVGNTVDQGKSNFSGMSMSEMAAAMGSSMGTGSSSTDEHIKLLRDLVEKQDALLTAMQSTANSTERLMHNMT